MMKKWIKLKPSKSIGIDVGVDNINVVLAKLRDREFSILHRFSAKNDAEDSVHQLLRSSILLAHLGSARVVIGLSDGLVIRKNIQLDIILSDSEIEKKVEENARLIFPDCYFDFHVGGINSVDNTKIDVEMVVASKKDVDSQLLRLEKAGYHVDIVDVNGDATERALKYFSQEEIKSMGENYIISAGLSLRGFKEFGLYNKTGYRPPPV